MGEITSFYDNFTVLSFYIFMLLSEAAYLARPWEFIVTSCKFLHISKC